MARRGGFILPIVLIVISLLAVTMASFVFFVRAEVHGTTAHADAQQALLAAESGLNEVIATLRLEPHNAAAWFDSPERFRHKLIWCELYERDRDPVAKTGMRELSSKGAALRRRPGAFPWWPTATAIPVVSTTRACVSALRPNPAS